MNSIAILAGYLAGSVPFAFLLARRAGIDVRRVGSRNVGAANVLRNTGVGRALLVTLLDVAKGAAPVGLALASTGGNGVAALTGAAAIVGHIYPVWLRFHGGKGVAVAAGVFAVLTPIATAIALTLFLVIVSATRYVSLGSVAATLALPPAGMAHGRTGRRRRGLRRNRRTDPLSSPRQPEPVDAWDGDKAVGSHADV